MNQEVVTLAPGGRPIAQALGFAARAVIVDNYTSSYVTLTDAGKTIPPWTYGAVVALPPGLRRATAVLTPSVPAISGPPVPVSQCTMTWTDEPLPSSPGNLLQQSQFSTPLLTDSIDTAAGTGSKTYLVPAGAQTVMVTINKANNTRSVFPTQLIARGFPSDFAAIGASGTVLATNPRQLGLFNPTDTTFDIEWTMAGANAANVLLDVAVLAVNLLNPQNVAFQFDANQNLEVVANNLPILGSPNRVLVTLESANPAVWQAPNQQPLRFVANAAAGGTATIIAAPVPAGQSIYLHYLQHWTSTATTAAFGYFGDSGGGAYLEWAQLVLATPFVMDFRGWKLPANTAFLLKNEAGVGMNNQAGGVVYSVL